MFSIIFKEKKHEIINHICCFTYLLPAAVMGAGYISFARGEYASGFITGEVPGKPAR